MFRLARFLPWLGLARFLASVRLVVVALVALNWLFMGLAALRYLLETGAPLLWFPEPPTGNPADG